MRIANENLIPAGAVDISVNANLRALWLGHICNYSIQLAFTGSPVGSFVLQASNDPGQPDGGLSPQATGVTHWTTIADTSASVSAAGDIMWNIENAGYTWVRVAYTADSGTGSLTYARANVKGV